MTLVIADVMKLERPPHTRITSTFSVPYNFQQ